jgi:hypothetical protein
MSIDRQPANGILASGADHGSRNEGSHLLLVRAVCLGVVPEGPERGSSEGVPKSGVQVAVLEPAASKPCAREAGKPAAKKTAAKKRPKKK